MDCSEVRFSGHAVTRMFERGMSKDNVLIAMKDGEIASRIIPTTAHIPAV